MNILGIHSGVSLNQHDPAAALICDGKLVACIEEERLIRIKSPRGILPIQSIAACLNEAQLTMKDIDLIAHPGETYLDMPERITAYLKHYFGSSPPIKMINHQQCHLASAFFHSGYQEAMCLSYDAYGDRLSAALAKGTKKGIEIIETYDSNNSLGVFYATMTSFLGFLPAEDEYKIMGLAPYGSPQYDLSKFAKATPTGYQIENSFIKNNPAPKSNWEPFYSKKLVELCGPSRQRNEPITKRHANIAHDTQKALEKCAISLIKHLYKSTNMDHLCIAGGIGLNCSANKMISQLPFVNRLFVQPAATDRGLALGAALQITHDNNIPIDPIKHLYMGPTYSEQDLLSAIKLVGSDYEEPADIVTTTADILASGGIVGWHQGRSEFGPRALGHRSILADPRSEKMKDEINTRVKYREEFRPFAPAVSAQHAKNIFDLEYPSPYMTVACDVKPEWRTKLAATTHVDGSARVQTVHEDTAPIFHQLIDRFSQRTDTPVLLNTSFNIKGQPIVERPLEALGTFNATGLDALCLGPFLIRKAKASRNKA